jgi:outer membrane lipoprotein carrier protein
VRASRMLALVGVAALSMVPVASAGNGSDRARNAPSPSVADPGPGEALLVARRVQERYDRVQDLSADFAQEMRLRAGGQILRSRGRMYFARPGRMRWEYETPEVQTIVADGEHLWIHQPEDNQVLRAPLERAFQSQTPVSFLFGLARIERDFSPSLLPPGEDGGVRLALEPRAEEGGALGELVLEVDPATWDLRAATVVDPLGNRTEVRLIDPKRNRGVEEARFVFERPPGTDLLEAPGH